MAKYNMWIGTRGMMMPVKGGTSESAQTEMSNRVIVTSKTGARRVNWFGTPHALESQDYSFMVSGEEYSRLSRILAAGIYRRGQTTAYDPICIIPGGAERENLLPNYAASGLGGINEQQLAVAGEKDQDGYPLHIMHQTIGDGWKDATPIIPYPFMDREFVYGAALKSKSKLKILMYGSGSKTYYGEIENTSNKTMFVKSLIANAGLGINSFKLQVQGTWGYPYVRAYEKRPGASYWLPGRVILRSAVESFERVALRTSPGMEPMYKVNAKIIEIGNRTNG
ncbi:hypothetical protein [uncultured Rothia sp.]|uniref:hypothetical protein n=1 Tax=uncultured Rothia sp. TaxID=316088 RepID=UPI00288C0FB4|nr:hypothetical protein [uncultured Rothia sp.]